MVVRSLPQMTGDEGRRCSCVARSGSSRNFLSFFTGARAREERNDADYACLGYRSSDRKFTFRVLPRVIVSLPTPCFGLQFKESLDGG